MYQCATEKVRLSGEVPLKEVDDIASNTAKSEKVDTVTSLKIARIPAGS